jgi:hypothetical protein
MSALGRNTGRDLLAKSLSVRLRIIADHEAHTAQIQLDTVLENCVFYILTMYEFSHSLDPNRTLSDGGYAL